MAASTAHNYYAYVRAFLEFCVRDGVLDSNPVKTEAAMEFLPEDTGDRGRQFWTDEARDAILRFVQRRVDEAYENDDIEGATAYRDRALVTLLALTGVRGAEVFRDPNDDLRNGLRWSDVNLDQGTIRVLGKSREYERVGLEDNFYLPSGERAADNAELVSKAVAAVENVGREARASGGPVDNSAQVVLIFFVRTATVIVRYVGFTFLPDLNFLHSGDHVHLGYGIRSRRRTDPAIQGVMAPGYWRVQSPIR